jgi:hypothetical protein
LEGCHRFSAATGRDGVAREREEVGGRRSGRPWNENGSNSHGRRRIKMEGRERKREEKNDIKI